MAASDPRAGWRIPEMGSLKIELLCGACADYGPDWAGAGRRSVRDDFARLYTLDAGSAEVTFADGGVVVLRPGMLGLIPAGRAARYRCSEGMRLAWFHFRVEILPMMDVFARWEPPRTAPCSVRLRSEFADLLEELGTPTPAAAFARGARLLRLLQPFLPGTWRDLLPPTEVHRRLQPTLDAMTRDVTRAWTLAELARMVHLHPTYFSNLFRETFGTPPLRYLGELRIRRARDLLRNTDVRISEVALRCGFNSPLHFSRVMHKATGVCPREFRARGGGIVP